MQRAFNRADEKAFLTSFSYDFAGVGVEGLSVIMNVATGFDGKLGGQRGEAREVDVTVDYRPKRKSLENFSLRLRGSWLTEDPTDRDGADLRLILRYDFPVI